eukprot:CAMPEP_0202828398 /NCGR_PEP_ID=MMETSP1389-20130828/14907_1 /ASSEMBLY_ACC=CAM_ASM_000865 /TAXON_ID=302021 /ORGANISM="Rhodomonas sp., Strain CCMP768" /LENGTH=116 /DNA_ID=CAMNT_0049501885 /DNA_START=203 /DNA_END=549 /DNA_ORIENTATION=+
MRETGDASKRVQTSTQTLILTGKALNSYKLPTMMLFSGINMSLTKNPMKPMIRNPVAVASVIFLNSFLSGFAHLRTSICESLKNLIDGAITIWVRGSSEAPSSLRDISTPDDARLA